MWLVPIMVGFGYLASVLPLIEAVRLPITLVVGVIGFLRPFWTLLLLILAIPLAPLAEFQIGEQTVGMTEPIAGLLLFGWLASSLARREIRLEGGALLAPMLAVLTVMVASLLVAKETGASVNEILKWVELLGVFLFVTATVRRRGQVYAILTMLFAAATLEAAIGLFQFVSGAGPSFFAIGGFLRAYGTFGQPNPFAGYLATVLPVALAVALMGRAAMPARLHRLAILACVVLAAAILTSLSRGTWMAITLGLGALLLAWETRTRRYVIPGALVLVMLGLLTALGLLPEVLTDRIRAIYDNFGVFDARYVDLTPLNFAVVERMAHWQAAWYMFLANPLLGVGIGNYASVYLDYALQRWPDPLGHAHNYYLNTLAETGVIGLATLLWVLVTAYAFLFGALRHTRGQIERALLVGVLGSLVVFTTFNTFDSLFVHGMTMQLGLLLGIAFAARRGLEAPGG